MNDTPSTSPTVTAATPSTPSNLTAGAGQLLRQYRESAGLHIVALSSALKVARPKLEALEADRLDELPDVVFARALAMSCCRYLGKDPEPVLALMPGHAAQPTPALRQHLPAQTGMSSRPRFTPSKGHFGSQSVPSWLVWGLVLMGIVVGGWFAAAPQRAVVKPPPAALDFPPQGVPGAEPVPVTVEPVASGAAGSSPPAVTVMPSPTGAQVSVPAVTQTPGASHPGNTTSAPVSASPVSPPLRVESVVPHRN